ncbi:hypothetical protein [Bacillus pinisoli]|nr:hypothetical protein [Bacillus pinisoli]
MKSLFKKISILLVAIVVASTISYSVSTEAGSADLPEPYSISYSKF